MKVAMAAPYANTLVGGGAYIQLQKTAKLISGFGVEAEYFDPWKKIDERDYDLVHIFSAGSATYDLAMRLADRKIPYVVSPVFFTMRPPWAIKAAGFAERVIEKFIRGVRMDYGFIARICGSAAAVLPNTEAEAGLIMEGMGIEKKKIRVITNGVDKRFYNADPALFEKQYGKKDYILYVGDIGSERKNVLSLVKALNRIGHPAVIIGETLKNKYAEECLAEIRRGKCIEVLGPLPHDSEMLASAYAACRVFVMPSLFETPSIAALEAGLAGASVVITKNGGTREYFKDHGFYVDPRSMSSIQAGLVRGLNAPVTENLKHHILNNFLWEKTAEMTADTYKRVL